jgi:hypothetical protein
MSNKRRLWVLGIIVVLVFGVVFYFVSKPSYDPKAPREPEKGGPKTVYIQNTEKISKYLLPAQFDVAKQAVSDYILQRVSTSVGQAKIVGDVKQSSSGVVSFSVEVESTPIKTLEITIDKWSDYSSITFTVPRDSFSVKLPVYKNNASSSQGD